MSILLYLLGIVLISLVIMYACDTFEDASDFLGKKIYKFPAGMRGATINAIGSSLPELFTTFFLLFLFHSQDGFTAGIATCAGSAVYNGIVIPALCVFVVLWKGVLIQGKHQSVESIEVERGTFIRDSIFFVVAEIALIYMLTGSTLQWWMGGVLMVIYLFYVGYLWMEYKKKSTDSEDEEDDDDDDDDEEDDEKSFLGKLLTLDFNGLLYNGRELEGQEDKGRAWVLLGLSTIMIAAACHFLADFTISLAKLLNVNVFVTAVLLAAAASSVPDTIISMRDARKGDYEDAISNAYGSNIFDICICLGLPLFLYGLIHGSVTLKSSVGGVAAVQELRILLILLTLVTVAIALVGRFFGGKLKFSMWKAVLFLGLYVGFVLFVVGKALHWEFAKTISKFLVLPF